MAAGDFGFKLDCSIEVKTSMDQGCGTPDRHPSTEVTRIEQQEAFQHITIRCTTAILTTLVSSYSLSTNEIYI